MGISLQKFYGHFFKTVELFKHAWTYGQEIFRGCKEGHLITLYVGSTLSGHIPGVSKNVNKFEEE